MKATKMEGRLFGQKKLQLVPELHFKSQKSNNYNKIKQKK